MAFHGDSRRTAPPDRFGVPGRQYPTPNIKDVVRLEDVAKFRPVVDLIPGTPHPDDPTLFLVGTGPFRGANNEVLLHYVYCSTRTAQDVYNASITYAQENHAYPIFRRAYFLPRAKFAPLVELTPLDSVIGLTLLAGGAGYNGSHTGTVALVFTGGGGSGAAGTAQVDRGVITSVLLTNGGGTVDGGTPYTSAPTVSVAGGTGASITALIQPQGALLIKQDEVPEEGEFTSLFYRVERVWETLPGPEIEEDPFLPMEGTGRNPVYCHNQKYTQRVAITTKANPVPSLNITGVTAANPAVITVEAAHGLANGTTFPIRIAGLTGAVGRLTDGDYTATATGPTTLTVPVTTTQPTDNNTGYLAWLKNGNIIIDSIVVPDPDAGSVTGTLITTTVLLPRSLRGRMVTKENGGALLTQTRTVQSNRTEPISGTLVAESSIIELGNGMFIVMTEVADNPEWPVRYGTHVDPNFGIVVDISRQAVDAGTLGDVVKASATVAIASIGLSLTACTITFATPHWIWPGDSITIAGVTGGTFGSPINATWVATPTGSKTITVPTSCSLAPTPSTGHSTNGNASDIYVDVQPVDFVSVRASSRLRASSVPGFSSGITYPVTVEFKAADIYGGEFLVQANHEVGFSYTALPGSRGSYEGYVTEYYCTKAQLAAWMTGTYSGKNYTTLKPSIRKGIAEVNDNSTRVYCFEIPLSEIVVVGDPGPSGISGSKYMAVHSENRELGLFRVLVTEIIPPLL